MTTKCGYIGLLGQVNAGKSTLLNACVGQKITGVSAKPNTTRNEILGISMVDESQLLFVDTPGLFDKIKKAFTAHRLGEKIAEVPYRLASEVDVLCYLIDIEKGLDETDKELLLGLRKLASAPLHLVITKCDTLKKAEVAERVAQITDTLKEMTELANAQILARAPFVLSAKLRGDVASFKDALALLMPEGPFLFDPEDLTNRPMNFVVAELIREHVFRRLAQEIPFTTSVHVTSFQESKERAEITADLIVNKSSHKPILIGKGGEAIKRIGIAARESLENFLGKKVRLDLNVVVKENWVDNTSLIQQFQGL